jgi:hypothetical protein
VARHVAARDAALAAKAQEASRNAANNPSGKVSFSFKSLCGRVFSSCMRCCACVCLEAQVRVALEGVHTRGALKVQRLSGRN